MVNSVGNNANSYSGTAIYCNNIDISKLSPEERKQYLDKMPNVTYAGGGPCYPAGYYTNNYANPYFCGNVEKKRVTVLTDQLIQQLDSDLESPYSVMREDAANRLVQLLGEDPTRHDDKALNVLLNKMLINPYDKKVRGHALNALIGELAGGDENTKTILLTLKNNPQEYNVLDRHLGDIDLALSHMTTESTVVYKPVRTAA